MKRVLILAAMLAAAFPVHADVYRCNEGGKAVYSDKPCASPSQPTRRDADLSTELMRREIESGYRDMKASDARRDDEARRRAALEAEAKDLARLKNARRRDICGTDQMILVTVGMTEEQVRVCAEMKPKDVSSTETSYGLSEIWTMDSWTEMRYIHFRNGKVIAISR
jgi:hypothetical protein